MLPPRSLVPIFAVVLAAFPAGGCAGKGKNSRLIWTQAQAERLLREALEAETPDARRRPIERVAESKYAGSDISVKTMDLVVRTDTSQVVRRVAARSLSHSQHPNAYQPLLQVLDAQSNQHKVRPPDAALRRACIDSLDRLLSSGVHCEDDERIIRLATASLTHDPDRDAKIAAARLLGHFQHIDALRALIDALTQNEFAVTYEAEQSLIKLTGYTQHRSYDDWRAWLDENTDPFARAGQTPPGLASKKHERPWWRLFGK